MTASSLNSALWRTMERVPIVRCGAHIDLLRTLCSAPQRTMGRLQCAWEHCNGVKPTRHSALWRTHIISSRGWVAGSMSNSHHAPRLARVSGARRPTVVGGAP